MKVHGIRERLARLQPFDNDPQAALVPGRVDALVAVGQEGSEDRVQASAGRTMSASWVPG